MQRKLFCAHSQGTLSVSVERFNWSLNDDEDDVTSDEGEDEDDDVGFPCWFSRGHDSCHGGLKNLMA